MGRTMPLHPRPLVQHPRRRKPPQSARALVARKMRTEKMPTATKLKSLRRLHPRSLVVARQRLRLRRSLLMVTVR